jgi:hypothetical protein
LRNLTNSLRILLRDFDYRFDGSTLVRLAIRGIAGEQVVGRYPSALAAVEDLLPIVANDEFTRRYLALTEPSRTRTRIGSTS